MTTEDMVSYIVFGVIILGFLIYLIFFPDKGEKDEVIKSPGELNRRLLNALAYYVFYSTEVGYSDEADRDLINRCLELYGHICDIPLTTDIWIDMSRRIGD